MLPTATKPPVKQTSSPLDFIFPLIRGLATVFIVVIGFMVFGMFGSLAFPVGGTGAFLGSVCCIMVSLLVACWITGLWKSFLPEDNELPHHLAVLVGKHGNFDLVLTVHETEEMEPPSGRSWSHSGTFLEVYCGSNPVQTSARMKSDGVIDEQFKLKVTPADDSIIIELKEKQILGDSAVGFVYIDIQDDIINADFPVRQEFHIRTPEGSQLHSGKNNPRLVLSFNYTEDYPLGLAEPGQSRAMETLAPSQTYGAVGDRKPAQLAKDRRKAAACC